MKIFFITGTDTDAGKTYVSAQLLRLAAQYGWQSAGIKPIASGAQWDSDLQRWQQNDVDALYQSSAIKLPLPLQNQYCFAPAIAPHLAAKAAQTPVSIHVLQQAVQEAGAYANWLVVEGAGGWLCPVDDQGASMQTLAQAYQAPVVLVVGLRLGCMNHALLSAQVILQSGVPFAGWIANQIQAESMLAQEEVMESLKNLMPKPLLGFCGYQQLLSLTATGRDVLVL